MNQYFLLLQTQRDIFSQAAGSAKFLFPEIMEKHGALTILLQSVISYFAYPSTQRITFLQEL